MSAVRSPIQPTPAPPHPAHDTSSQPPTPGWTGPSPTDGLGFGQAVQCCLSSGSLRKWTHAIDLRAFGLPFVRLLAGYHRTCPLASQSQPGTFADRTGDPCKQRSGRFVSPCPLFWILLELTSRGSTSNPNQRLLIWPYLTSNPAGEVLKPLTRGSNLQWPDIANVVVRPSVGMTHIRIWDLSRQLVSTPPRR